jgi:hypothetical protein
VIWIKQRRISESVRDYKIARGMATYSIDATTIGAAVKSATVDRARKEMT